MVDPAHQKREFQRFSCLWRRKFKFGGRDENYQVGHIKRQVGSKQADTFWGEVSMNADSEIHQLAIRSIRQIELDSLLALERARFSVATSDVSRIRCVDLQPESEESFGQQLWFFEASGMDNEQAEKACYGVLHYSVEFGLLDLLQGYVFDCPQEREHCYRFFKTGKRTEGSWHPANRWLLAGVSMVGLVWVAYLLFMAASL